ncbi:hypothetical protein BB559_004273 [Furculomyces boomerangus]|uniref:Essential protein Yae1 N-terminal domain-containing protein n=2 Tax=Harpellales TaxID=61421 RepID=A0A2T9YFN5_9FUNG|nr:hypothetical protein BB559_004273 [Furculomyces boomerangus]PWA01466.1 hypothetical protein BB558_002432 [Smittium angustum]
MGVQKNNLEIEFSDNNNDIWADDQDDFESERRIGYREGLDVGKQQTTQEGFDVGLRLSMHKYQEIGSRIGTLSALKEIKQKIGDSSFEVEIDTILSTLQQIAGVDALNPIDYINVSNSNQQTENEKLSLTEYAQNILVKADELIETLRK